MPEPAIDEQRLKALLKAAVLEALEEQRDFVRNLLEEALEDIALSRAIEEGSTTKDVPAAEIHAILGRRA